ncbi:SMI1/KNR4 family protein [Streptomyces sp. FBKL.4005]|uniref:SMI1/KNR4 family protein n=1 Tax=Streptomyces sp. FBKL.4005 TaxID=2015515 RepID=UPI000B963B8A|nr:SMI1/KNR4 family protein [Streptomyces sp. FBKL.4005]OYP16077.1 SMI1/KNR4 family protein [Streptomyces sp. FBKL.4005]
MITTADDRGFPAALAAAFAHPFDYADGDGVDFEPFDAFLSAEETTDWFRAWTGNAEASGDVFRVFGCDGTGGYAAFWLVRPGRDLAEQPVVFLGSEGETGVVARDLADFLWVLADGLGPREAAEARGTGAGSRPDARRTAVAERFAPGRGQPAAVLVARAGEEFPGLDDWAMGLCR